MRGMCMIVVVVEGRGPSGTGGNASGRGGYAAGWEDDGVDAEAFIL